MERDEAEIKEVKEVEDQNHGKGITKKGEKKIRERKENRVKGKRK